MIDARFVQVMARYNAWQNRQVMDAVDGMTQDDFDADRGAFFRSIRGTLNHLLWADSIWMSRFSDDVEKPSGGIADSAEMTRTMDDWQAARVRLDGRIRTWADTLSDADLAGDLAWYSGATGRDQIKPRALCVVHMFNHQTHHRGQLHAMLSAAGQRTPVSDLAFMPEDA